MDWKFAIAIFVAFLGAATLNIGKGLQKMKVGVFAQRWGMFKPPYRRDAMIWIAGLGMTASFGPCQWLAMQMINNPSLPVAMMGVGLVGLVLFAIKIIGEKLDKREIFGIALIIVSTFTLVYTTDPCRSLKIEQLEFFPSCASDCSSVPTDNFKAIRECCGRMNPKDVKELTRTCIDPKVKESKKGIIEVPVKGKPVAYDRGMLFKALGIQLGICLVLGTIAVTTKRIWGLAFGFCAGSVNGIALTLVKVAAVTAGSMNMLAQLQGPWIYIGLVFGIFATVFTNIGFTRARALIVVPTYTSLTMMTPALMEYFVFDLSLSPIQYASLGVIVAGVVILCSGASEAVLSGNFSAGHEKKS